MSNNIGISSRNGGENEEIFGSDIKLLLKVSVENVNMNIIDFDVVFKVGNKSLTLNKSNLVKIDDNNYLICIKHPDTDIGTLTADVILKIPDQDFSDNICTKIKRVDTGITIIK